MEQSLDSLRVWLCCWMAFPRDLLDDRINSSGLLHSRFPIQWTLCTVYLFDSRSMHRLIALPAAFTLVEAVRYRWPFGGVPLATIAMSQSDSPSVRPLECWVHYFLRLS